MRFPEGLASRYQPLRALGKGAMGAVFLARDQHLGREVAIKIMLDTSGAEARARFQREAQALAGVEHPNVVRVYEFGTLPEGPFLVLEYLDGVSLEDGTWSESELLEVARAGSGALEAVHAVGIVHRDVKPANFMRTRSGRVVLTDFGLVHDAGRTQLTGTGALVGTLAFLSPEALQGGAAEPAQDWWALGGSLYYLAEARLPFTSEQLLDAVRGGSLPLPRFRALAPDAPLRRVIEKLLERGREQRLVSGPDLRALLGQASGPASRASGRRASSSSSGNDPAASPPRKWGEGRGLRAAALLLSGGLLLGGLWGTGILGGGGEPTLETAPVQVPPGPGDPGAEEGTAFLGPDSLDRLRREYQVLETLWVGPEGQEREFSGDPEGPGWRSLVSPDPLYRGTLRQRLPLLDEVFRWVQAGGDATQLSRMQLEVLEELDDFLEGQAHAPPFSVLRRGLPREEPVNLLRGDFHPLIGPPPIREGWVGTAVLAYRRARRMMDDREREWEALSTGTPEQWGELPASYVPSGLRVVSLDQGLRALRPAPFPRSEVERWVGQVVDEVRLMVFALGRSLEHQPSVRDWILASAENMIEDLQFFYPLEWTLGSPDTILERSPVLPSQWYLLGVVQAQGDWCRREVLPRARTESAGGLSALDRARRDAPPEDSLLAALALRQTLYVLESLGRHEELMTRFGRERNWLRENLPEYLYAGVLRRVLASWRGSGQLPDPQAFRDLEEDVGTLFRPGVKRWEELAEDLARFRAVLRAPSGGTGSPEEAPGGEG